MAKAIKQHLIVRGDAAGLWLIIARGDSEVLVGAFAEYQVIQWINAGVEMTLEGRALRILDKRRR